MTKLELAAFTSLLKQCPEGPRIEFGVFRGHTLQMIAQHSGVTIGVDSFTGMAEPSELDIHGGVNQYPRGRLAAPMSDAARLVPGARLVKGFVPDVLPQITETGFGFAHLDMDHYAPTRAALLWLWPRMRQGGIVCCDDWFLGRNWLAAAAINEFATKIGRAPETAGRKAWWSVY